MNYLSLGGDTVVSTDDVLAVCDLDNASYSHITRDFLKIAQQEGRIALVTDDLPRSMILCRTESGKETVYLSGLNAATLLKRAEAGLSELI